MKPVSDLIGVRFGMLLVNEITSQRATDGSVIWQCICDCGIVTNVSGTNLKSNNTKSCGFLQIQHQQIGSISHGHSIGGKISDTYMIWANMIQRCTNPKNDDYKHYGARGITVCERWLVFENFLQDMGERPNNLLLDREDNNKGYDSSNCRWVTSSVSNLNRRPFKMKEN